MQTFVVLKAVAVAAVAGGLLLLVLGVYGQDRAARRPVRVLATGRATASRRRLANLGVGAAVSLAAWVLSGWPVAAVTVMALWVVVPYFFGTGKIVAARIARLEALDTWTMRLAEVIAAGMAPVPAIVDSAEHAPAPIRAPVTRLATKLSTPRLDRQQALREFADEIDDTVGDLIALSLGIAVSAQTSDKVPDVLRTLASGVSEEVKARREIEAKRSGPRSEARLMVILVLAMVFGFSLLTDYAEPFNSLVGQMVLAACAGLLVLALLLLRWFSTGSPPPRILPRERDR